MKITRVLALVLGLTLAPVALSPSAHAEKKKPVPGADKVKWEDKWYPLDDGIDKKLMARRGYGPGGLGVGMWLQIRNDYDRNMTCRADITCTHQGGFTTLHLWFLEVDAGDTDHHFDLPGEEISEVLIQDLKLEDEKKEEPKK
ncbi:hypothetical protein EON80_18925 [bacterium]|nr:MAG: hypothetical protein EON80_18925 [bacterium]